MAISAAALRGKWAATARPSLSWPALLAMLQSSSSKGALANAANLTLTKQEAEAAITHIGLTPNIRGEALNLEQFALLTDYISED